ncbi:MAG: carboxypeptidase-like regulatory domain-containing protein [Rhodospirillales bacterium]|nr:carboxypeptidase-like regulatory domain-containing protein [Rhodospirillales bacterium]
MIIAALRFVGQAAVYAAIALLLGYFAQSPLYSAFPDDMAQIKLSFVHGAEPRGECRRLTQEELEKLAPNMRKPIDCPRQRLPLLVELLVDGEPLYRASVEPTGLSGDGPSRVYERFTVSPGGHLVTVRLRDSARAEGFDYERTEQVVLRPGQNLAIDFRAETGGFLFL